MKTIKSKLILLLAFSVFSFILVSCHQDEITENEQQLNIDFNDTDFEFMNEDFIFKGSKDEIHNDFLTKLDETILNENLYDEDDMQTRLIKWDVSFHENKILVQQRVKDISDSYNKSDSSCPDGLKEFGKCSGLNTESCTKEKAGELASNLKKGETFSVTRTGFASTLICGSASLVDRVLKK